MAADPSLTTQIAALRIPDDARQTFSNVEDFARDLRWSDFNSLADTLRSHRPTRNLASDVAASAIINLTNESDETWDPRITQWLTSLVDLEDDNDAFEIASSAITWKLRSQRPKLLNSLTLGAVIQEQEAKSTDFHTDLTILLQAARYDFNFERIERILNSVGHRVTNSSLYYRAMLQYSRLGRGKDVTRAEVQAIIDHTDSEKILSLLLHGLWFTAGAEQSSQMLEIGHRLLAINEFNSITHMRMAAAYRRKGDFPAAIRSINEAISLHPPLDHETHGDLKLERVTIAIQQDAHLRLDRSIDVATAQIEHQATQAETAWATRFSDKETEWTQQLSGFSRRFESQMSDSLFKVVEILGLFTALIGLIASVVIGNALGSDIPWYGRTAIILVGGAITIGFFALLRRIVQPRP